VQLIHSLKSRRDGEEGFTLIELMVVVLIIAILIAIAIPTFLGARERAQNRAAQSDLRNALTAEKTFYTDKEAYAAQATDVDANGKADLVDIEPSLNWTDNTQKDYITVVQGHAVVANADGSAVCVSRKSASGKTYALVDVAVGPNAGTYYDDVACPASVNAFAGGGGWSTEGWN